MLIWVNILKTGMIDLSKIQVSYTILNKLLVTTVHIIYFLTLAKDSTWKTKLRLKTKKKMFIKYT